MEPDAKTPTTHTGLPAEGKVDPATNPSPGVGGAGTPAEAGLLVGAEREKQGAAEPIADPLQAAQEIEREEKERGEINPAEVIPEPGDVLPS